MAREHWQPFTWEDVEKVKRYFIPWDIAGLTLDAVNPPEDNLAAALAYLRGSGWCSFRLLAGG